MSMVTVAAVAVMLCALAVAVVVWLRLRGRDRGVLTAWKQTAKSTGLTLENDGGRPALFGRLEGMETSVEILQGWLTLPDEAWTVVQLRHPALSGLTLANERARPLLPASARGELVTGNEVFDRVFLCDGDEATCLPMLAASSRRVALDLATVRAVAVHSGVLLVGANDLTGAAGQLDTVIAEALKLARELTTERSLVDVAADPSGPLRKRAMELLVEREPTQMRKLAADKLGDSDAAVALLAATIARSPEALEEVAGREQAASGVRLDALRELAKIAPENLAQASIPLVMSTHAEAVVDVLELLRKHRPAAMAVALDPVPDQLIAHDELHGDWGPVAQALAATMAATRDPRAEGGLLALAAHFTGAARRAAVMGLGLVGTEESVALLLRLGDSGAGREVRRALADIQARAKGEIPELSVTDVERILEPVTVRRTPAPAQGRSVTRRTTSGST